MNERLEIAKRLNRLLGKYIYLTDKIQHEVIHADTFMLYRKIEGEIKEQANLFIQELNK